MYRITKKRKEIIKRYMRCIAKPTLICDIISMLLTFVAMVAMIVVAITLYQKIRNSVTSISSWLALFVGFSLLWITLTRSLCQGLYNTIWPEKRIIAGVNVFGTKYDLFNLLDEPTKKIVIAGQNLYSCFANTSLVDRLVDSIINAKIEVVCILTTREAMASIDTSGKGTAVTHYDRTINTLKEIYWTRLSTSDERKRLSVYFHLGSASLSATIRDPEDIKRAKLIFMPKWTINVNPKKRMYCVIDKWENHTLFEAIYFDITHMTLIDEKRMDWGQRPE